MDSLINGFCHIIEVENQQANFVLFFINNLKCQTKYKMAAGIKGQPRKIMS